MTAHTAGKHLISTKTVVKKKPALACAARCLAILFAVLSAPALHALGYGEWTESAAEAKRLAQSTNRPLLAVFYAGTNCSKCETLEDVAWETAAFKNFAKSNKIVLYRNKVSSNNLRINTYYKSKIVDTTGAPTFFIFKVNNNATFDDETYKAFTEDQVTLPQVTKSTPDPVKYTGRSFTFNKSIFGVNVGSNAGVWSEAMAENIIRNCFPNDCWSSLSSGSSTDPVTPVNPTDPTDPTDPDDPDDPVNPSDPQTPQELTDTDKWLGKWLTSAVEAKKYARENNRPLLAVFYAGTNCAKCETLEKVAWETQAFKQYAIDNKLVLYRNKVSANNLRINAYYKTQLGDTTGAPTFFIFKVNSNASSTSESYTAFNEDEVTIPQVTGNIYDSNRYTGRTFVFNKSILDVATGSNAGAWSESMVENIINNCFPNTCWKSMELGSSTGGGGTTPVNPTDPDDPDDPVNPTDPDNPTTPTELTNTDKWLGKWLTSAVEAKQYARENNRPLLAVFYAGSNCAKCETLEDVAWETPAFKNFATENKLVLYRNKVSANNLRINSYYKAQLGDTTGAPTFFIFKVNNNASSTSETYTAFNADEVSIPQVTWNTSDSNKYTGRTFVFGASIFGVYTGTNAGAWSESMVESIITNSFPNNYWESMEVTGGGGGDDPVDPSDPDDPVDPSDPDDPVDPSELIDPDKWLGKWLTSAGDAKRYALENNRPLLAVFYAGTNCAKCETLESVAWETQAFKQYATERQLVLYRNKVSANNLRINNYYKSQLGDITGAPTFFIFKVNKGATFDDESYTAFTGDEVTLPQVTWNTYDSNKYTGRTFVFNKSILDVATGSNAGVWSEAMAENILNNCFPNECFTKDYWKKQDPPAPVLPTALDLGVVPWENALPEIGGSGLAQSTDIAMAKGGTEWLKFTGNLGKRYWCYANCEEDSVKANLAYTVDVYTVSGSTLASTPFASFTFASMTEFNNGFWFDTAAGSSTGLKYYIKITASGTSSQKDTFKFVMHQTAAAPTTGSMTRPYWTGATLGKWTMDIDKAMANAYTNNKPVLLYFSGLGWCPYCAGMELNVLTQTAFTNAIKNYYNVLLDFRRRNDRGPSLLIYEDEYLNGVGATAAQGLAKLAANRAVQEALATPGFVKAGWDNGAVGYPTLMLCRVVKDGTRATTYRLEPVKRGGSSLGDAATVATTLAEWTAMWRAGYTDTLENIKYNDMSLPLTGNAPATIYGGGQTAAQWMKFTANSGLTWVFKASSASADDDAQITYSVYSEDGQTLIAQYTTALNGGSDFIFSSEEAMATTYWLSVEISGQDAFVTGELSYRQSAQLSEVSMAKSVICIQRENNVVKVPLLRRDFQETTAPVSFRYTVVSQSANIKVLEGDVTCEWPDDAQLDIPLDIPFMHIPWTGNKNVIVTLHQIDNGGCVIGDASQTTIKVFAETAFCPLPETRDFTVPVGVTVSLDFPVCASDAPGCDISKLNLPRGLSFVNNLDDPDNPRVSIVGIPTATTSKPLESTLYLTSMGYLIDYDEPHSIAFTISVVNTSERLARTKAFSASLAPSTGSDIGAFDGLFFMTHNDDSTMSITVMTRDNIAPATAISGWSSYDGQTQTISLTATADTGETITVSAGEDATGTVTFISAKGREYVGTLHPVTLTPAQYKGRYNVALREYDDIDGLTEGWLTYDVNASGVAAAKLHLNRLNTTVEFNTCVNDDGTIFFYAPAYPNARGDGYVGEIAGTLTITPVSERQTSADIVTDTWISSGKDMFSKLMLGTGEIIPLTPTGTTFLSNRSIAYCVGTSVMYFVAECPEGAYVPNYVNLSENRALTLSNASKGPLSQELSDIVVNPQDGTFTGTLTVLAANDDDSSTVRFADIPFSGLMVPTTNQCCGGSANIAVGYGSYLFGDNVYRIRIFADQTYSALAAPTVATAGIETIDGHDIHVVRCTVPPIAGLAKPIRALLCKNDAGEFCVYTWDDGANTVELYLDGEYAWQISSLAVDERLLYLEGQPAAESTAATAAAVRMITYGTTADVDVRLTPGWNLIGVPSTLQLMSEASFEGIDQVWTMDVNGNMTISDGTVTPGAAYWVFLSANQSFSIKGFPQDAPVVPVTVPQGWSMMAYPGRMAGTVMYVYKNGRFVELTGETADTTGVWIYRQ